ncbi:unnamed protein product [Ceratitis capitata]|uniref:(Mediterranean fruit fly) hypothetical protein n=1 Tax=Ceratitis capitata TaxID=7213 RepID=A0A811U2Y6_CERCA|nr:unnamed protein product [Ceratitis capitata]
MCETGETVLEMQIALLTQLLTHFRKMPKQSGTHTRQAPQQQSRVLSAGMAWHGLAWRNGHENGTLQGVAARSLSAPTTNLVDALPYSYTWARRRKVSNVERFVPEWHAPSYMWEVVPSKFKPAALQHLIIKVTQQSFKVFSNSDGTDCCAA